MHCSHCGIPSSEGLFLDRQYGSVSHVTVSPRFVRSLAHGNFCMDVHGEKEVDKKGKMEREREKEEERQNHCLGAQ